MEGASVLHTNLVLYLDQVTRRVGVEADLLVSVSPGVRNINLYHASFTSSDHASVCQLSIDKPPQPCSISHTVVSPFSPWEPASVRSIVTLERAIECQADVNERGNVHVELAQLAPTQENCTTVLLRWKYQLQHGMLWSHDGNACVSQSLRDWVPCTPGGCEHRQTSWNITVHAPEGWTCVATGEQKGTRPWRFEAVQAQCMESVGFYAERSLQRRPDAWPVIWSVPSLLSDDSRSDWLVIVEGMASKAGEFFQSHYSKLKQPWSAPDLVLASTLPSSELVHVWNSFVCIDRTTCMRLAVDRMETVYALAEQLAQGLAQHAIQTTLSRAQWCCCSCASDVWLEHALVERLASRCLTHLLGINEVRFRRLNTATRVLRLDGAAAATQSRPLSWDGYLFGVDELRHATLYRDKSQVVLHMLEHRLCNGTKDNLFDELVARLLEMNQQTTTTNATTTLTSALEESCVAAVTDTEKRNDIRALFRQWVRCNGYPSLRTTHDFVHATKTNTLQLVQDARGFNNSNRLHFEGRMIFRFYETSKTHEQARMIGLAPAPVSSTNVPIPVLSSYRNRGGFLLGSPSPFVDACSPRNASTPGTFGGKRRSSGITGSCASVHAALSLTRGTDVYEVLCTSAVRKNRKRKPLNSAGLYALPLSTLLVRHNNTPVLYVRCDPHLSWFGLIVTRQSRLNAARQALDERELEGQLEGVLGCAIEWRLQEAGAAEVHHTPQVKRSKPNKHGGDEDGEKTPLDVFARALLHVLTNEQYFFAVRALAGRVMMQSVGWWPESTNDRRRWTEPASRQALAVIQTLCMDETRSAQHHRLLMALLDGVGDVCASRSYASDATFYGEMSGDVVAQALTNHPLMQQTQQTTLMRFLLHLVDMHMERRDSDASAVTQRSDRELMAALVCNIGKLSTGGLLVDNLEHQAYEIVLRQLQRDQIFPEQHYQPVAASALIALARIERSQHEARKTAAIQAETKAAKAASKILTAEEEDAAIFAAPITGALAQTPAPVIPAAIEFPLWLMSDLQNNAPTSQLLEAGVEALMHVLPVRGTAACLPHIRHLVSTQLTKRNWSCARRMIHQLTHALVHQQVANGLFQTQTCVAVSDWMNYLWSVILPSAKDTGTVPVHIRHDVFVLYEATWGKSTPLCATDEQRKSSEQQHAANKHTCNTHALARRLKAVQDLRECRSGRTLELSSQ